MRTPDFIAVLKGDLDALLIRLAPDEALVAECQGRLEIPLLLKIALKNELEATLVAARWIETTPEVFAKLAFARQAGDEAKHYRLIQKRLAELGVDTEDFDPVQAGLSPLSRHLLTLDSTIAKAAAGPFAREAIAVVKNQQFIRLLNEKGDLETARIYEEIIQPDESYHHQLGEELLLKLIHTEADQAEAKAAIDRTLALAEELTRLAAEKQGIVNGPGC